MVTIPQIQRGFAVFVDNEVATAFTGWQKVLVVGAAGLLSAYMPNLVKTYGAHPLVSALGVYDPAAGTVNIDALYNAFVPQLGTEKIPIPIPKIGTVKMGREEIDNLVRYIKEV